MDIVPCNCKRIDECPLGEWCNSENRVSQVCIFPIEHNDGERIYIGISAGIWKQQLYNHRHSFSTPRLRNQTALSKYVSNLKDQAKPSNKAENSPAVFNQK